MLNEISLNTSQFLQLATDIRTSSTSTFNAQEAYENSFEDVMMDVALKNEEEKENKINFTNLGMPAGFFLDTSLLSEEDKLEVNGFISLE